MSFFRKRKRPIRVRPEAEVQAKSNKKRKIFPAEVKLLAVEALEWGLSPAKRRRAVEDAIIRFNPRVSQRRACKLVGQGRSTQRKELKVASDEEALVKHMTELACDTSTGE